ncbi:MAG: hypothetical protein AAF718_11455 [Pseudomonadota bacterium]
MSELDEAWWFTSEDDPPTPRNLAEHVKLVEAAELRYPIILCADGRLMDGMHRAVKAVVSGRAHIDAVQFLVTPPPDHVNVPLNKLPYPEDRPLSDTEN